MSDTPLCSHECHIHCNICGGAVCRNCYGQEAPTAQIKYGPSFPKNHATARLNAQLAALNEKVARVRDMVESLSWKHEIDTALDASLNEILREVEP